MRAFDCLLRRNRSSKVAVVMTGVKSESARYEDDTRARWQYCVLVVKKHGGVVGVEVLMVMRCW